CSAELPRYDGHEGERRNIDAIKKRSRRRRLAQPWDERTADCHKEKSRKKYTDRGRHSAYRTSQKIANKGCRGEHRPRRDLPNRDRIEELSFSQPPPALYKIRVQER